MVCTNERWHILKQKVKTCSPHPKPILYSILHYGKYILKVICNS